MKPQAALQTPDTTHEHQARAFDRTRRLRDLLGVGRRELLTTADVATDFGFPSRAAVRMFLRRHARPGELLHVGRGVRIERRVFQAICDRLNRPTV